MRRYWPWRVIDWSRLLDGRWRDPMVGRDLLLGCAAGVWISFLTQVGYLVPGWLGLTPEAHMLAGRNLTSFGAPLFLYLSTSIQQTLTFFFAATLLLMVLRREWLAYGPIFVLALLFFQAVPKEHRNLVYIVQAPTVVLGMVVALRFGMLPMAIALFVDYALIDIPVTYDLTTWYALPRAGQVLILTGLGVAGYVVSRGGRPLLGARTNVEPV